jgi:site-specific DNA-methyltransferase (adenine-specific)
MNHDHIYEMDCFNALPLVPDDGVVAVITDPPYPNGKGLFSESLVDGLAALYQCCKKAAKYVVFFWRATEVPRPPPGWYEVARHIWHKPDSNSRLPYEAIVVWSKERKYERCRIWTIPILSLRTLDEFQHEHPTRKPLRLLRYLVEQYTKEGDTVLDPFAGSGTTLLACKQLKRHYIGIEKNPTYVEMARSRVHQTTGETLAVTESTPEEAPPRREERRRDERRKT